MSDEVPIPLDVVSAMKLARDQIVACVDAWGAAYWESDTIGHAGKVTQEFLRREGALAPRAVITAIAGDSVRIGGGKSTQLTILWQWFIVVDGTLEDRTDLGLILAAEGVRLVAANPWGDLEDSAFSRTPESPVRFRALYDDDDEDQGLSIWGVQWRQAIDLGTAKRPRTPGPEELARVLGTITIPGSPNNDTVGVEVD